MASDRSLSRIGLHSVRRLSDRELAVKLGELNAQKYALDAELLLYLSEIERRGLYREQACSSLFVFCVTRLGQSEDVAYKRVGAARLMLKYPVIYELLGNGRIHLSGLMLLRPHLSPDNCQELLLAACGKSKRQIEELVATRFPQPDVPTTERKLPPSRARHATADSPTSEATQAAAASKTHANSDAATVTAPASETARRVTSTSVDEPSEVASHTASAQISVTAPTTTAPTATAASANRATGARVDPLSAHSYRVTFTASERLKQMMDRARELLSHAISPSDLPALLERALDQLIEREERRRYGSSRRDTPKSEIQKSERSRREASEDQNQEHEPRPAAAKQQIDEASKSEGQNQELKPRQQELPQQEPHQHERRQDEIQHCRLHASCQKDTETPAELPDPDPISGTRTKLRSRYVPAAVGRAVWTRDAGQCTFEDGTGRRCEQRHFLGLDHIEAFAIGGDATVENLRLRCHAHNALEAEKLFGRERIERIIAHETQAR